jgi:hypothetical protein
MCKAILDELKRRVDEIATLTRPKWEDEKALLAEREEMLDFAIIAVSAQPKQTRKRRKKRSNKPAAKSGPARRESHATATA